jgi:hypothetical protein
MDLKLKALLAHGSQVAAMDLEDVVRRRAEEAGQRAGVPLAEGFRTFAFKTSAEAPRR